MNESLNKSVNNLEVNQFKFLLETSTLNLYLCLLQL